MMERDTIMDHEHRRELQLLPTSDRAVSSLTDERSSNQEERLIELSIGINNHTRGDEEEALGVKTQRMYADRAREAARRQMELAEAELAKARRMREQARAELSRAHRLKEEASKSIQSTCLEVTCQSCRQRFQYQCQQQQQQQQMEINMMNKNLNEMNSPYLLWAMGNHSMPDSASLKGPLNYSAT